MAVAQTSIGSTKQVVALPFGATDIANANGTLKSVQTDTTGYTMPFGGSVIGVSGSLTGTLTTGTMQFQAVVNGSLMPAFDNTLYGSNGGVRQTIEGRRTNMTFQAGDTLELMWQKTGTIAPTTRDGAFLLIVLLEEVNY